MIRENFIEADKVFEAMKDQAGGENKDLFVGVDAKDIDEPKATRTVAVQGLADVEEEPSDKVAKYVIAMGYRNTVARLHRRDGCYRGRTLSVAKDFELVEGVPTPN